MLKTKVQKPDQTSARAALRRATHATHQRMHGLEPFAQIAAGTLPIREYQVLLHSLFRFHSAVGGVAIRSGWSRLSSATRRLELLRSDISYLGGTTPLPVENWQTGGIESVLGALYAAEGSMLGGRVIARQLDYLFGSKREGRSFFVGDESDPQTWSRLLVAIEAACALQDNLNAATYGALRTFNWFEQCVTRTSHAQPLGPRPVLLRTMDRAQ